MSMTRRTRQVGEFLREELTDIIRTDVKDPRVGFFTITRVDIGPDLRNATAMVSVLGTDEEREETLEALRSAPVTSVISSSRDCVCGRFLKSIFRRRSLHGARARRSPAALKELERERETVRGLVECQWPRSSNEFCPAGNSIVLRQKTRSRRCSLQVPSASRPIRMSMPMASPRRSRCSMDCAAAEGTASF